MIELNASKIEKAIAESDPTMCVGPGPDGEYSIFARLPTEYREILPFLNNKKEFRMELFNALEDHIHSNYGDLRFWMSLQFNTVTIRLSMENMAFLMIDPYGLDYGFHGQEIESEDRQKILFGCLKITLPIMHKHVKKLLEEHPDLSSLARITGEASGTIQVPISEQDQ